MKRPKAFFAIYANHTIQEWADTEKEARKIARDYLSIERRAMVLKLVAQLPKS